MNMHTESTSTTPLSSAQGSSPSAEPSAPAPLAPSGSTRLVSLDALRGFTMFWIMGGRELVLAIVNCVYPPIYDAVETQITHTYWQGFVCWDLIMPLFLFLVGTSLPFAHSKRVSQGQSLRDVYARTFRRVIVLWLLGMLAQGSLLKYQWHLLEPFSNTLQAIAVGYLVTTVAMLHLRLRGRVALFVLLVVSYWILLTFVPFGGHPAGTLQKSVNLPRYIDELVMGPFRRQHSFTWIVTSLGFSATVLLGTFAGQLLRTRITPLGKLGWLIVAGCILVAGGWMWSYWLPLNRYLWTSSLILWAGGWSCLLLALFYGVIDIAGFKSWAFPLVVIGSNALLAYVFDHVFDRVISDTLVLNLAQQLTEPYGELVRAIGEVGCMWLILWYLYRQGTFLRA